MNGRPRDRVAEASLIALLVACLSVALRVLRWPWWPAAILGASALVLQLPRVSPAAQRTLRAVLTTLLTAACVVGFVQVLYPVLPPEQVRVALRGVALSLCAATALVTFGVRATSPGRVSLLAATGVLLAAALNVSGDADRLELPWLLPAPLIALAAYLIASTSTLTPRGTRGLLSRRILRLAASLALTLIAGLGVTRLLPWAAPLVEAWFGDGGTQGTSGFSDESRLGTIEKLALDDSIALRVWADQPRYLRLRVATRFSSNVWRADRAPRHALSVAKAEPPAFAACVADVPGTTVAVTSDTPLQPGLACGRVVPAQPLGTNAVPTPSGLRFLRASSERIEADDAGIAFASADSDLDMFGYGVWPERPAAVERPEVLAASLEVPTTLDPRLRTLADQLKLEASAPAGRIQATLGYLQGHCRYALDVGRFQSRDPVAEFVLDKRRGYCEYFASAAALLLRLQGVPTRYVTGFAVGSTNLVAGHYLVRMSDAHAWVEAYVDGHWFEIDPTPPADYASLHSRRSRWWSTSWEWMRGAWTWLATSARQLIRAGDYRWLGRQAVAALRFVVAHPLVIGVVLLAVAAARLPLRRWLRQLRSRPGSAPVARGGAHADLRAVFSRMERLVEKRGAARPLSRPPLEHLRGLPEGTVEPELRQLAGDIVAALYAALFDGKAPSAVAIEALRRRLHAVESRRPRRHAVP